jgi:two-component system, cell cycle response regulator
MSHNRSQFILDTAPEKRNPVILVADDEPVNRKLIQRRLERENYEVITAEDGEEALKLIKASKPDLVLLDVMMPVIDRFEVCRSIKGDVETRDIPVIFLSARDETEIKINGLALGANDYISKPFKAEELMARVNVALRLKHERDLLRSTAEEAIADAEQARERAMTDALTGLYNRYGLQRALARERAGANRYSRPLSCMMIDLDKFKHVNDTYGHPTGDLAIRQTSQILTDALRRSDLVFRYGGEEFLVLLPETNLDGARGLANKIRSMTEDWVFGSAENSFHLTLSVGVAELRPSESGHDMIARADMALYRAKERGRNRVDAEDEASITEEG